MPTTFLNSGDAVLLNPTSVQTVSGSIEQLVLDNSLAASTTAPTLAIGVPQGTPRSPGGLMLTGTSAFTSMIEIHNDYANGIDCYTHASAAFRAPTIQTFTSGGTQQAPTAVPYGQALGYFLQGGYNGSKYVVGLTICTTTTEAWTPTGGQGCLSDFYIGIVGDPLASNVKSLTINGDTLGGVHVWRNLYIGQYGDSQTVSGLVVSNPFTPTSAGSSGIRGQIAWDANNIYVCTNGGAIGSATWKAAALTTV